MERQQKKNLFTLIRARLTKFSSSLNTQVERVVIVLMVLLVLDVWLGVLARYVFRTQVSWTEEAARYIMIWAILLAISCGVARREHIGILALLNNLSPKIASLLLLFFDMVGIVFFTALFWFGLTFVEKGGNQHSMIFGITMALPYASVPVCAMLCLIHLLVGALRDFGAPRDTAQGRVI